MCVCVCGGTNKWRLISRPLALSTSSTRTFHSFSLLVSLRLSLHLSLAHSLSNTWQILFMATRAAFLKGAVQRLCRWEQSEGVFERLECTFAHAAAHGAISVDEMVGGARVWGASECHGMDDGRVIIRWNWRDKRKLACNCICMLEAALFLQFTAVHLSEKKRKGYCLELWLGHFGSETNPALG